jgi:hypothetical protein
MANMNKLDLCYTVNNCGNTSSDGGRGNTKLYHRGCCHNFNEKDCADFLTPVQQAIDKAVCYIGHKEAEKAKPFSNIIAKYNQGQRQATAFENAEWDEGE